MDAREVAMYQELIVLIYSTLLIDCPVLSGNMQHHIEWEEVGHDFARIVIKGPSYDIHKWMTTGEIERDGKYDYAVSVNEVGAFNGRSKKSKHWVDKAIDKACNTIASIYGAEVIRNV